MPSRARGSRPCAPSWNAWVNERIASAGDPNVATTSRSLGLSCFRNDFTASLGLQVAAIAARSSNARARRGRFAAMVSSRRSVDSKSAMVAIVPISPMPAHTAVPVRRSPSRAAHATAYGPPPEYPMTPKRSMSSASASAASITG